LARRQCGGEKPSGAAVIKIKAFTRCVGVALAAIAVTLTSGSAALAADDFPIVGDYTQNVPCKGDGTDSVDAKVTISTKEIVSNIGPCTILDTKISNKAYVVHVECKFPAGPLMGEITFTPRPDNTLGFVDRDKTYNAVLHRCPN
jgi:hypothetical protein